MSYKVFNKEIARSIRGSIGRFIAIAGIVALGCGFYAGLRTTAPDMNLAADDYYDQSNLMDVRVVGTLGLTDEDIEDLKSIEGVEAVKAAYETDVLATVAEDQYAMRAHSITEGMSEITIAEGSMPDAPNECVLSADKVMGTDVQIGEKIYLTEGTTDLNDVLVTNEFTVVGLSHSPYYVSSVSMGTTTLGSGSIQQYMYVNDDAFSPDYPITEAFITVEGAKDEFASSDGYQSLVDEVAEKIEGIAPACEARRIDELRADAQRKLDEERSEYESERAAAELELADAKAKLDRASAEISRNESKLSSAEREYASGQKELSASKGRAEAQIGEAEQRIEEGEQGLASADRQIEGLEKELAQVRTLMDAEEDPSKKQEYEARALYLKEALEKARSQRDSASKALDEAKTQLSASRKEANRQISDAERRLASAKSQIDSGRYSLSQGKREYESGYADYLEGRRQADAKFAEAESKFAAAQAEVDDIGNLESEWLIMDRTKNHGVSSFEADAARVDNIAAVFPFIFFLVAALVALTTMTRMVDEDRMLIGTFKALGYSRARITFKYLVYAGIASGVGAVLGIALLSMVLPLVIMIAYSIIYYVPHSLLMPIDPVIATVSAALGIGVTLLATWLACVSTLRESPAYLMLPRSPKAGKRILLERIKPLWSHLSFLWKVTFRNLFRYKKRLVMTVIGIAGCTALLLTGLGLQDSINDIIDKQFGSTVHYNVVTTFEDQDAESRNEDELLGRIIEGTPVHQGNIKPISGDGKDLNAVMVVPEDPDEFEGLWTLRERTSGNKLDLDGKSAIVNEKLARELGIEVGDTLVLAEQDEMGNATGERFEFELSGIMENYVNNYVFLGEEAYEGAFGGRPEFTSIYGAIEDSPEAREGFSSYAHGIEGVKTVSFSNETIESYRTMLKSVDMIVVVLVIAAAALAFIVLYNLTNINITERRREIATLEVLGFTKREIYLYIFREIILLTVIGALLGLVLGIFLEGFVVVTAEVDYVMFGREIHPLSFALGFALTLVFALAVMFFMRKKLDSIDMVDSLKTNE